MNIINIQGGSDFAKIHFAKFFEIEPGSIIHKAPGSTPPFDHFPGFRLQTRYCPNSGPERVALVTDMGSYAPSLLVRHRKSTPKKIVLENLSNNMYGTISTKCCDYLNIPMIQLIDTESNIQFLGVDNSTSSPSLKYIRLSLDSFSYSFGVRRGPLSKHS
ncbi:hypothetical protein H8356DRAFT_1417403 [Neocallimastix lanati (nom. inval.)]|nr:hypothetical protein H8356DRAFT_1417403 [Neocallimastix sp. JGI-2020a]